VKVPGGYPAVFHDCAYFEGSPFKADFPVVFRGLKHRWASLQPEHSSLHGQRTAWKKIARFPHHYDEMLSLVLQGELT